MTDSAIIAAATLAISTLTWLLFLSYTLGRYAARTDALERAHQEIQKTATNIYERLEKMAAMVPHTCNQQARLAVIEERQAAIIHHTTPTPA